MSRNGGYDRYRAEQIAGWLKRTHPEDGCNQVSHETIYRSLFVQTRGVLKKRAAWTSSIEALYASLQAGRSEWR